MWPSLTDHKGLEEKKPSRDESFELLSLCTTQLGTAKAAITMACGGAMGREVVVLATPGG